MLRKLILELLYSTVVLKRNPDMKIGSEDDVYLRRWWVIPKNPFFNVYLHHFLRSDDDRALHDHPWWNVSWLLKGSYYEMVFAERPPSIEREGRPYKLPDTKLTEKQEGSFVIRRACSPHRIVLFTGPVYDESETKGSRGYEMEDGRFLLSHDEQPVWTLFITGPKVRSWGFWCRTRWVHWKDFVDQKMEGAKADDAEGVSYVGAGCGEEE